MQGSARDRKSGAIEARRIPFARPVELRNPLGQGHDIRSTANISMTGMFVVTEAPLPRGTTFSFSCRLDDDRPFEGLAEVRWTRPADEGPHRPAGMGVRFLELDDTSGRAVRRLVEKTLHEGPARHHGPQGASPAAGGDDPDREADDVRLPSPGPQSSPWGASADWREEIRQRRKRRRTLQLAATLAVALAILVLWIASPRLPGVTRPGSVPMTETAGPEGPPAPTGPTAPTAPVPESAAAGIASRAAPASSAEAASKLQAEYAAEVEDLIDTWVAAWTEQRVDDYLACYGPDFAPDGMARATWAAQRRERISRPSFIQVRLTGVTVVVSADGTGSPPSARATFVQAYRSDAYRDTVLKTLDLTRTEGRWRIVGEASETLEL